MTQTPMFSTPASGWDLHCHTVFSDGTKDPAQLVQDAQNAGLHGVAITDHDTAAGWAQAAEESKLRHMPVVYGTEVTAEFGEVSVHMLAYQYDSDNTGIVSLFESTRRARLDRARRMVLRLSKDFPISWDSVLRQTKEGENTTVGRPHMADALVAAGVYGSRSEAFAGAISSRAKYYIPTPSPNALDVVKAVKQAGGVSVVAHPGDRSRNAVLLSDTQIGELAASGLDGLEVWHRGNDTGQRHRLLELAGRYGLLVTGGSDWHGAGKPNLIGENLTDDSTVEEIVRRGIL